MLNYSFRDTELDMRKEIRNSLQGIWGVGWYKSNYILSRLGLAYPFKGYLNVYLFNLISFLLNKYLISRVKAERIIDLTIKNFIELKSYKGQRHLLHLPVRGQRSRSNARTIKRLGKINFKKNKKYGKKK
jgi:small subunit ribosomal protein S13